MIYEKNLHLSSKNEDKMPESRAVNNFLNGIGCPWFLVGKAYIRGSGAHKNDLANMAAYLEIFVRHGKGGGRIFLEYIP